MGGDILEVTSSGGCRFVDLDLKEQKNSLDASWCIECIWGGRQTEKRISDDCECIQNNFFVNVDSVMEVSGGGGGGC